MPAADVVGMAFDPERLFNCALLVGPWREGRTRTMNTLGAMGIDVFRVRNRYEIEGLDLSGILVALVDVADIGDAADAGVTATLQQLHDSGSPRTVVVRADEQRQSSPKVGFSNELLFATKSEIPSTLGSLCLQLLDMPEGDVDDLLAKEVVATCYAAGDDAPPADMPEGSFDDRSAEEASEVTSHGAAGDDAPPADTTDQPLYWNTRLPGNDAVLDPDSGQVGIVLAGREYAFETALDLEASLGVSTPAGLMGEYAGTDATFQLSGSNIQFQTERSSEWLRQVDSPPMPCGDQGTDPFRVLFRVPVPGQATIELRLATRRQTLLSQRIELQAVGVRLNNAIGVNDTPPRVARSMTTTPEIDGSTFRETIGIDISMSVREREGQSVFLLSSDGCGYADVAFQSNAQTIATTVAALRPQLIALLAKYPTTPGPKGEFDLGSEHEAEVRRVFAEVGTRLHSMLFGTSTSDNPNTAALSGAAQCLATSPRDPPMKLQIIDPRLALSVPWGLVYDAQALKAAGLSADRAADGVDEQCFWGRRFSMLRYVDRSSLGSNAFGGDGVHVTAVINRELGATTVSNQLAMLNGTGGVGECSLVLDPVISDPQSLLAWAKAGDSSASDVLYFFCHARAVATFGSGGFPAPAADPGSAAFGLAASDGDDRVSVADLEAAWGERRERRPLVLLNACGSTQADPAYGLPFVSMFMRTWQARALVGTDWSVPTRFADSFSRLVMAGLRRELTIADSLRHAANVSFSQGNLYPLMYALYGQMSAHF